MHPIFEDVRPLDSRCCEVFSLSEEVLMEHAALALKEAVFQRIPRGETVLFLCGPGNNGADGLACARLLLGEYNVQVALPFGAKSPLAKVQKRRLEALHVKVQSTVAGAECVVDALFGSGQRALGGEAEALIRQLNAMDGVKIACDIPTGLGLGGEVFRADCTVTMGALKQVLFGEEAKAFVGTLVVAELGLPRKQYETCANLWLLEAEDMRLPHRNNPCSHKGHFGHVVTVAGEKEGASLIAADAAFAFGAGLVSVLGGSTLPMHVMGASALPHNASAIVAGMGLGQRWSNAALEEMLLPHLVPVVADADLCYLPVAKKLFDSNKPVVFTPHPKEFQGLLVTLGQERREVEEIQRHRVELLRSLSEQTCSVLVLKGVHTLIAQGGQVYLSPFGCASLSTGGSGDVLAGLIGALLAQGYEPKEAAISAVLAHGLAAQRFGGNSYALTPQALIEGIKCL